MLKVDCPLSGVRFTLPQFGCGTHKLSQLHPLFHAELSELNKIKLPASNYSEAVLLIHAYLWRINLDTEHILIEWHSGITRLSENWIQQEFIRVVKFVNYCALNKSSSILKYFPKIRISHITTGEQISFWLDRCEKIVEDNTTIFSMDKRTQDLYEANLGQEFTHKTERRVNPFRRTRTVITYIQKSFAHFPSDKIESILRIILRPQNYEIKQIREVKLLCLDFLLETSEEFFREKNNILLRIDQALYDKLSVLERLNENISAERAELQTTYTIYVDGKETENAILQRTVENKPTIQPPSEITEEPKKENFKSNLAYVAAMRRWNERENN